MAKYSPEKLDRLLLREEGLILARNRTAESVEIKETRIELLDYVREVGKSGDLNLILGTEQALLQGDLDRYANSGAMKTSLRTAIKELADAREVLPLVADPVLYRAIDKSHAHHKSRVGGLPKDAARQFFNSNAARLLNMDKSRLDAEEKAIVEIRKGNMRTAEGLYAGMQREALGVAPARDRDHGLGR